MSELTPEQADRLIDGLFDESLSVADAEALQGWLLVDIENAKHYARRSVIQERLFEKMQREPMARLVAGINETEVAQDHDFATLLDALDDHAAEPNPTDITQVLLDREQAREALEAQRARQLDPAEPAGPRVIVIPRALVWLSGAAAILLLALLFWPAPPHAEIENTAQVEPDAEQPLGPAVAEVRRASGAVWATDHGPGTDHVIHAGKPLTLTHGVAELRCHDGAEVLIQAPARFVVTGPNAMRLDEGRLSAVIPPSAKGFTVQTTQGQIVDLGTEFGLWVSDSQSLRAEVFIGEITHASPADDEQAQPMLLKAGEAIRADAASGVRRVPPEPTAYVRADEFESLLQAEHSAYHRWRSYCYQMRRDPDLLAFYSMDAGDNDHGRMQNLAGATSGRYGAALGDGRPNTAPSRCLDRFGQPSSALSFNRHQMQVLKVDDWPQVGELTELTVSCWFQLEHDAGNWPLLVTQWDDDAAGPIARSFHLGVHSNSLGPLTRQTRLGLQAHASFTGSTARDDGWDIKDQLRSGGSTDANDGWVHVALTIQCGGGPVRLYKNGVEIDPGHSVYTPAHLPLADSPMVIGGKATWLGMDHQQLRNFDITGYFHGRIDDVALYRRALDEREVVELYQAGQHALD